MLQLVAGRQPGICELRSTLDKLKHVPPGKSDELRFEPKATDVAG